MNNFTVSTFNVTDNVYNAIEKESETFKEENSKS